MKKAIIITLILSLVLMALLTPGCGKGDKRKGVIVIVLDALRRDHLSMYGYERDTSPFLARLSEKAAFFTNAQSAAPQTVPSVSSLLTGLYPYRHGSHFFSVLQSYHPKLPVSSGGLPKMREENKLLAEYLKDEEFFTAAVSANPGIRNIYGFAQGLDYFRFINCYAESEAKVCDGARINRLVENDVIPKIGSNDFFLYLHYMDVHNPYFKPNSFKGRFMEYAGEPLYVNGKAADITAEQLAYSVACYDEGIIYQDRMIEELFALLDKSGLLEDSMVVIVSDHGDEFMEHGGLGHGTTVYNELIDSFIILRVPGSRPVKIDRRVSLVDILPTVLDWAGADYNEKKIDGISLTSYIRSEEQPEKNNRIFLSELGDRKALTDNNLKYIYNVDRQNGELYNLEKDPGETRTIIEEKVKRASRYKKLILRIIKRMQLSYDEKTLSEDERKNLESLSYIN